MRPPLTEDDVLELEVTSRTPEQHRRAAAVLAGWAEETHPDDDDWVNPAMLLVSAGEHLERAGDLLGAVEVLRRAVAAPGEQPPDKRCYLHHALMQAGDMAGARVLATEIRRSAPADLGVYVDIADHYEQAGNPQEALRWLELGLGRLENTGPDEFDDYALPSFVRSRRRVRQELGYPPDELDESIPLSPGDDG